MPADNIDGTHLIIPKDMKRSPIVGEPYDDSLFNAIAAFPEGEFIVYVNNAGEKLYEKLDSYKASMMMSVSHNTENWNWERVLPPANNLIVIGEDSFMGDLAWALSFLERYAESATWSYKYVEKYGVNYSATSYRASCFNHYCLANALWYYQVLHSVHKR